MKSKKCTLKKSRIAELEKKAEIEFKKNPTIMEQLDLKDGKLAFKDGSILAYAISEGGSDWRKIIIN